MTTIRAFHTGHCSHPSCIALKGSGLASRCFPSQAYLLETRKGLVLWDTGYANHFMDASSKGVYRLYPAVTPVTFESRQSLVSQLKAQGIAYSDIHAIVLSHFHADHMAGLLDFPNARVYASQIGWNTVRNKRGIAALRQAFLPGLVPGNIEQRMRFIESAPTVALPGELTPFESAHDILGNGDLLIVPLPGHAPGHLGAFVPTEKGWVLLASDAAWAHEAYQELRGPSELAFLVQDSRSQYYETLARLQSLHIAGTARIELTHVSTKGQVF